MTEPPSPNVYKQGNSSQESAGSCAISPKPKYSVPPGRCLRYGNGLGLPAVDARSKNSDLRQEATTADDHRAPADAAYRMTGAAEPLNA
jgi:hypothetical protein